MFFWRSREKMTLFSVKSPAVILQSENTMTVFFPVALLRLLCYNNRGGIGMNIQIFGTNKCFDTKKAQRFFKERGIKFQFVDLADKGISKGELENIARATGGVDGLINTAHKDYATVAYLLPEARKEKLLENPRLLKTPIVRNGKQATVGYCPEVWKGWE